MSRCFKHVTMPEMNEIVLQKTAFFECAGELSLALDRAQNLPLCVKDSAFVDYILPGSHTSISSAFSNYYPQLSCLKYTSDFKECFLLSLTLLVCPFPSAVLEGWEVEPFARKFQFHFL